MRPPPSEKPINVDSMAQEIAVNDRVPLRIYYRIADSLLKQARIYREKNNVIELYTSLLKFLSLVSETIPSHRDYQLSLPKERAFWKKKSLAVLDELESLQPKFRHLRNERNKAHAGTQEHQFDAQEGTSYGSEASLLEWPPVNRKASLSLNNTPPVRKAPLSSWKQNNNYTQILPTNSIDSQFPKLSVNRPLPNRDTLSRHSFLGPNGLRGQWLGPSPEIKVHYPSITDLTPNENSSLNQEVAQYDLQEVKDGESGVDKSTMESLLSLDDGRWSFPADDSCLPLNNEASNAPLVLGNIRQPSPPPVLAQVYPDFLPISPSRVADRRPGPAKPFQDGMIGSNSYQHLHIDDRAEVIQAWYMDDSDEDQRLPHHREPKEFVSLEQLAELGVLSWRLDADNYETDEKLKKIREERGYSYMDFCEVCPEKLPNYEEKIKNFFEEHLHTDEEIRYCVAGSGYFDVRDRNDAWIRVLVKKGGMIVLPAGIYHRFTLDTDNYIKAMRLFIGDPIWTPFNRPHDHLPARKEYVEKFVQKEAANHAVNTAAA